MIRRGSKGTRMIKDTAVQILLEHFSEGMVRTIVDALIEDEREECAKICENEYIDFDWAHVEQHAAEICAEAIRARGQE